MDAMGVDRCDAMDIDRWMRWASIDAMRWASIDGAMGIDRWRASMDAMRCDGHRSIDIDAMGVDRRSQHPIAWRAPVAGDGAARGDGDGARRGGGGG